MFSNKYNYILVPGFGGIEISHWMRHWIRLAEDISIVKQENFQEPDREKWASKIAEQVAKKQDKPIVLICHSLGCISSIYAAKQDMLPNVVAAFMVAMPSENREEFHDGSWTGYTPYPIYNIPFPCCMVYSDNDEYCSVKDMGVNAEKFSLSIVHAGSKGHLGSSAKLGPWEQGQEFFKEFLGKLT